jgi:N-acetylglucosaminyldiphosphoundecaprenol N-acetyl-beta-D-mannosaminyltransferase
MEKVNLLGMNINTGTYAEFLTGILESAESGESRYACLANVHMLIEAYRVPDFAEVVKNACIVTPDGMPLSWALRMLHGIKQERVAGMDLLPDLLQKAAQNKIPVYFYGGQEYLLQKADDYLAKQYPGLPVAGTYSPPFRSLTKEEDEAVIERINNSGARLVFVVLGCPKQERWMAAMEGRINAVMVGVGGALPVMLGEQKRAPDWMQHSGLEWLYRLIQEPVRLFERYVVTNTTFLLLLFRSYLKVKLF